MLDSRFTTTTIIIFRIITNTKFTLYDSRQNLTRYEVNNIDFWHKHVRDWYREFSDSRHHVILHASTSYLHTNCAICHKCMARRKNAPENSRLDSGREVQCVLNKRISGEKADNSCSFPSTTAHCSTLASFHHQLASIIHVCASARTHCDTVLSTVRHGKCDQHRSIIILNVK